MILTYDQITMTTKGSQRHQYVNKGLTANKKQRKMRGTDERHLVVVTIQQLKVCRRASRKNDTGISSGFRAIAFLA